MPKKTAQAGIRVNTVNPDAATYGIQPEQLEEHHRRRTTLKVNVLPEDVAEAVLFFASSRSAKSTGNLLNVDGGVASAYTR